MSAHNAELVVDEQEQDITLLELFNPVYEIEKKTLKYHITPYNITSIELPVELGESTLIIDATPGDYIFDGNVFRKLG
ncbi:MAG: hypothetical protein MRJ93_11265 [Nitrososphaeraceae archaeon]|nr:hypothetical protein [Nitrososphaeraceae archaeon]